MYKTYVAKQEDIKRQWFVIDAKNKILGRVATQVAKILIGKHKPIYTPHIDTGDAVIVINAAQIRVTGRKLKQKVYRRYSGYPGGLREVYLENMLSAKPTEVMRLAVRRMLPQNRLGAQMFKKLKVYAGETHQHQAQNPKVLEN